MPIEVAALAATVVVKFLAPYVKVGAKRIVETAAEKFSSAAGEHVAETAESLWSRVRAAFDSPDEQRTLERFEKDPERMAGSVEVILEEKLERDEEFARELEQLVEARSPDGAGTGAEIMHATVAGIIDLRQARISGGTFTAVDARGGIGQSPNPNPTEDQRSSE